MHFLQTSRPLSRPPIPRLPQQSSCPWHRDEEYINLPVVVIDHEMSGKAATKPANVEATTPAKSDNRFALFDHLPRRQVQNKNIDSVEGDRVLHPATIKLGALYCKGTIQADDDRVTALLAAFCNIIQDYKTPPKKVLREDLDKYISKQVL